MALGVPILWGDIWVENPLLEKGGKCSEPWPEVKIWGTL